MNVVKVLANRHAQRLVEFNQQGVVLRRRLKPNQVVGHAQPHVSVWTLLNV